MLITKPSRGFNLSLLGVIAFNLVPHVMEHLFVLLLFGLGSLVWRLAYEYQKVKLPNFLFRALFVSLGVLSVYFVYGNFRSVESTSAFLLIGASLKMLDNVEYRDAMVLLFVNFLVLMTAFLQYQTMGMTLFGALVSVCLTGLLFQLHKGKSFQFNFWAMLKMGAKLCAAVLPLLILLFVVFPRVSTGILSNATPSAKSGFSNTMEPGSIDRLALSDELAFRVSFDNREPKQEELYWRGTTFTKAQGLKWTQGQKWKDRFVRNTNILDEDKSYQITLEPEYGQWLFFLDVPDRFAFKHWRYYRNLEKSETGDYRFKKSLGQKFQYRGLAQAKMEEELSKEEFELYLQTQESDSDKLKHFVDELQQKYKTQKDFQTAIVNYFMKNLRYELDLSGGKRSNSIEEFLFEKKLGFCEHFATSFSYIMRLAGYPARVVAGFQGGKKNPLSDYYVVTNRDAHAWSEVYNLEKKQWERVDPTRFVAPARIRLGGQLYHSLNAEQLSQIRSIDDYYLRLQATSFGGFLERTKLLFDMLEERWNNFLLTYDFDAQKSLFAKLGVKIQSRKSLWFLSLSLLVLFYLAFRYYRFRRLQYSFSPVEKRWTHVQYILAKCGFVKNSKEGPSSFFSRLSSESEIEPDLLEELKKYFNRGLYSREESNKYFMHELNKLVSRLKENLKS